MKSGTSKKHTSNSEFVPITTRPSFASDFRGRSPEILTQRLAISWRGVSRVRGCGRWRRRRRPRRCRRSRSSNTAMPAAVVPPGDVTCGAQPDGIEFAVEQQRRAERAAGGPPARRPPVRSPRSTAASISASATRNRYAGPDPATPVNASSNGSGSSSTVPTDPRIDAAHSMSPHQRVAPPAIAAAPRTDEGRACSASPGSTATAGPTAVWSVASRTPAAIDNTRVAPASRAAARPRAAASAGLTASIAERHGTGSRRSRSTRRGTSPPARPGAASTQLDDAELVRRRTCRTRSSRRAAPTPCCRRR